KIAIHAGALLELRRAALRALDLLDEHAELQDDLVDRLLVEAHLLERVDHLLTVLVDVALDALATRLRARLELRAEVLRDLVEVLHLVDEAQDAAVRLLLVELGVVVLGVADDVLDADLVLPELVTEVDDLAHRDGRIEDRPEDHVLAL